MNSTSNITRVNSTTYADLVGLQLGIERRQGEDAPAFLERLRHHGVPNDRSFQALLSDIALRLGLDVAPGIHIESQDEEATVTAGFGKISVNAQGVTLDVPLLTMDSDYYWHWRKLSEVANDLSQAPGVTASLLIEDGWSYQLCRQSNVYSRVNEPVLTREQVLEHKGIVASSVRFNREVAPDWYVLMDNELIIGDHPDNDLTISYQYKVMPYDLVCAEVGLFSLNDPALASAGVSSNGALAYQLREFIQTIMRSSGRTYWGR